MIFSMLRVLRRVLLFWEKIPFWKWNDLEICSVKWNSGKFPDEMETKFFWFGLRNPEFYPVYGMEIRNLWNRVLKFWNVPEKFRFLFCKLEKFPGFIL